MKNRLLEKFKDELFITDSGLETELIFNHGYELPEFAAFPLLEVESSRKVIQDYYQRHLDIATRYKTGIVLEAPTWRASSRWAQKLGLSKQKIKYFNEMAVEMLITIRDNFYAPEKCLISGCIGPYFDGYSNEQKLTSGESTIYHKEQIETFKNAGVDLVSALTLTNSDEAIGICKAAQASDLPVVISFTVETDGLLPNSETLADAINKVDLATNNMPIYYMINCAHPSHFAHLFEDKAPWTNRVAGIRANASCKSHAELDEATQLDRGDPVDLSCHYSKLKLQLQNLKVVGGCCGTNYEHIEAIAKECLS